MLRLAAYLLAYLLLLIRLGTGENRKRGPNKIHKEIGLYLKWGYFFYPFLFYYVFIQFHVILSTLTMLILNVNHAFFLLHGYTKQILK